MKNLIKISAYCIPILFFACNSTDNKLPQNDSKMLAMSRSTVRILQEAQILKDTPTCFMIVPSLTDYKIADAFVGCTASQREYDMKSNKIVGCGDRLIIENDTVKIYVTYNRKGEFKFEPITLMMKDNEGQLGYVDTSFLVNVK